MGIELKKPWYSLAEIKKYPYQVVIGFLLSWIIGSTANNGIKEARLNDRIEQLTNKADEEKTKRIEFYEKMIFYKGETERLQNEQSASDSLVRTKTQPFVDKILSTHE